MEGFTIRVWDFILPWWRWLYEPQIVVQHSARGVGVFTPCRAATRGTAVFIPGVLEFQMCPGMEGFLFGECELILLGWRYLHVPQPISNEPVMSGFPHRAGRFVGVVDV